MFITYTQYPIQPQNKRYSGLTVSILEVLSQNFYRVGSYNFKGIWVEWEAHEDELIGFEGI
jgi:hypothetical protein